MGLISWIAYDTIRASQRKRIRKAQFWKPWAMSFALAAPIAGVWGLCNIGHHPPPPSASQVSFGQAEFIGDGSTAIQVDVTNSNAAPVTVHTVTLQFTDAGRIIATAAEPVTAITADTTTVPSNQVLTLTAPAPQAALNDPAASITVTGWK